MQLSYLFLVFGATLHTIQSITVETKSGLVESIVVRKSRKGIPFHNFLGVPYAAPPTGELRFRHPQKPAKWNGIRNASEFGNMCTQSETDSDGDSVIVGDEDCLYLNIYTRKVNTNELVPVMIYFHGGAFLSGKGSSIVPTNIMDYPVVFITFNYRLGVFGFLSSGDRLVSGNYGLKDQLMMLQWVRDNIRQFGGDPASVTIIGHSAGASSVHEQTLSPHSKGLFHRAMIFGGNAMSLWSYFPQNSLYQRLLYEQMVNRTDCWDEMERNIPQCLRFVTAEQLEKVEQEILGDYNTGLLFRPVLEPIDDEAFLTKEPKALVYPDPTIPIMFSLCSSESVEFIDKYLKSRAGSKNMKSEFARDLPTMVHYRGWIDLPEEALLTDYIIKYYFGQNSNITLKNAKEILHLYDDILLRMSTTDSILSYPGKKYVYFFNVTHAHSAVKKSYVVAANLTGASHGDDLFFLFHELTDFPRRDIEIAEKLMNYYINFVYTGNPNSNDTAQPFWSRTSNEHLEYMYISDEGFKMTNAFANLYDYSFYKSLPIKNFFVNLSRTASNKANTLLMTYFYFWFLTVMSIIFCVN